MNAGRARRGRCSVSVPGRDLIAEPPSHPGLTQLSRRCNVPAVPAEAAEGSSAPITSEAARHLHKAVVAVPGSVFSPLSVGTHVLLRDGAGLVQNARDILAGVGRGGCRWAPPTWPEAAAAGGRGPRAADRPRARRRCAPSGGWLRTGIASRQRTGVGLPAQKPPGEETRAVGYIEERSVGRIDHRRVARQGEDSEAVSR